MRSLTVFNVLSEHIAIRIRSCSQDGHGPRWVESKAHLDYDLWLLQEGNVRIQVGEQVHTARPGDGVLFYPHVPYTASTGEEGFRFIYVHFDFIMGNEARVLNDFQLSGIIPGQLIEEESSMFARAYKGFREHAGMSGIRLKGCLTILLSRIVELYGQEQYTGAFAVSASGGDMAALQPVFQHMHSRIGSVPGNRELARLAGMSEKYFITYFKKTLGITPGQYMYQLRMNRARDYLQLKKYTMREIADQLGYPDPYAFSKAFKKYYGIPPSSFV